MTSSRPVIEFIDVTKSFSRQTGRALLGTYVMSWFGRRDEARFVALKNISFQLHEGEALGVVGANGAGKSTLLCLAAGIATPDQGRVIVNGRTAALLELGSGFHPDLTGRENLVLNAALLGLTRRRANELEDSIIEFSGIGDFIGQPLRTYSTGMTVRLAFAVAIHMDPTILIVDEVLAVGDHSFQQKCMEKVAELKREGKTMLFVSHSPSMVQSFCNRALWLDQGEIIMEGNAGEVLEAYQGRLPAST